MALYNSGFPVNYQYYPIQQNPYQMQQNTMSAQPTQTNGIIWVQGEAGAKSYLVAPNTTVQLWDSEAQKIYLKSADASGMPSIKTLDYTIRGTESSNIAVSTDDNKFISRDEFNGLKSKLESLQSEVNKLKPHKKEDKRNG